MSKEQVRRNGLVRLKPETLRAFRKKAGLSQAALAAEATRVLRELFPQDPEVGISESLVALIETRDTDGNPRRQPSVRNAEALATALGLETVEALADIAAEEPGEAVPA